VASKALSRAAVSGDRLLWRARSGVGWSEEAGRDRVDERAPAAGRPRDDGDGSLDRARRRCLTPASLPAKEPWRPLWGLTYKDYEALPADGRRYERHEQQACRAS